MATFALLLITSCFLTAYSNTILRDVPEAIPSDSLPMHKTISPMSNKMNNKDSNFSKINNERQAVLSLVNSLNNESTNETIKSGETISLEEALKMVVNNLRSNGRNQLADQIEELALYVINLEKIKASGVYDGTEMEHTLDENIAVNKAKLIAILDKLLNG